MFIERTSGNQAPPTNALWPPGIVVGMRFVLTSSITKLLPWTGSAVNIHVYRANSYTGSYTCSLWQSSSQALLGWCIIPTGSGAKWESASLSPPVTLSLDTEYRVGAYMSRGAYSLSMFTNQGQSQSYLATVYNPMYNTAVGGCYIYTGSVSTASAGFTFPFTNSNEWYGLDVLISGSDFVWNVFGKSSGSAVGSALQASIVPISVCVGDMIGSVEGGTTTGKYYQTGITQSLSEGNTAAPSLCIHYPGKWRFKWEVKKGVRKISVKVKQSSNVAGKRPSLVVRQNASIGIPNNVSASAAVSSDWVTIGPVQITPTRSGVVWVELWNNDNETMWSPAYFDTIVST